MKLRTRSCPAWLSNAARKIEDALPGLFDTQLSLVDGFPDVIDGGFILSSFHSAGQSSRSQWDRSHYASTYLPYDYVMMTEQELEEVIAALVARKDALPDVGAEYRFLERQLNALRYTYERAGDIWEELDPCWGATPLAEVPEPEGQLLQLDRTKAPSRE
jgi:hypothetical protein